MTTVSNVEYQVIDYDMPKNVPSCNIPYYNVPGYKAPNLNYSYYEEQRTIERYRSYRNRAFFQGMAVLLVLLLVLGAGFYMGKKSMASVKANEIVATEEQELVAAEPVKTVTVQELRGALEVLGFNTTIRESKSGTYKFSEGKIPFLTKINFTMDYVANITAGIDQRKVDVEVTDDFVKVIIPHATILSSIVDTKDVDFSNETNALFNHVSSTNMQSAINAVTEEWTAEAVKYGILDRVDTEVRAEIDRLLTSKTEGRPIIIVYCD